MYKIISMQDTDLTGTWYFTKPLAIAEEVFEDLLESRGFCLQKEIVKGEYLFPIVDAKCTYYKSPTIRDKIKIEFSLENETEHSFTMQYKIFLEEEKLARVYLTHAVLERQTMKKTTLPSRLRDCLNVDV